MEEEGERKRRRGIIVTHSEKTCMERESERENEADNERQRER